MADYVRRISNVEYSEYLRGESLNLYLPMEEDSFPLLIFFSDCITGDQTKEDLDEMGRALAGAGIAVAVVDVRDLDHVTWHACLEDAAQAVIYMLKSLTTLGDVTKVYVGGAGSGASAAMMLAFDKNRLMCRGADPDHLAGWIFVGGCCSTMPRVLEEKGADPGRFTIDMDAPLYHLPSEGPPILIVTGAEDRDYAESVLLAHALERRGYENSVECSAALDYISNYSFQDGELGVFTSLVIPFITEEEPYVIDD